MGDLWLPASTVTATGPFPTVILAHGIAAERSFRLEPFARAFRDAGMAALVFDYRGSGESPGVPRGLVDPQRQVEDYLAAMRFARSRSELDPERIALWGTSFSGGHVLVAGAKHPEGLRAVVAQIPFVSGISSTLAYPLRYHLPAIVLGIADRLADRLGRAPLRVPVVRERGLALLASEGSHPGYMALIPPGSEWPGTVPARVFLEILRYHPARHASQVVVPTCLLVAEEDAICPPGAVRRMARRMREVRLETFPIGHFDAYGGVWLKTFISLQAAFLRRHLDVVESGP